MAMISHHLLWIIQGVTLTINLSTEAQHALDGRARHRAAVVMIAQIAAGATSLQIGRAAKCIELFMGDFSLCLKTPEGTKSIQKLCNFEGAEITSDPCWNDESYISVILARILSLPLPPQNHPCPNLSKCLVAFPHFPRFATLIQ